jgi:hypothetical protein
MKLHDWHETLMDVFIREDSGSTNRTAIYLCNNCGRLGVPDKCAFPCDWVSTQVKED